GLNDDMLGYCQQVQSTLQQNGFRVTIDYQSANVKKKIRDAQLDLVPYMMVVGPKDRDQGGVSLRDRLEGDLGFLTLDSALTKLKEERDGRVIRQVVKSNFQGFQGGSGDEEGY
ncbi:MAG: threonine--tRNA ligase, partial [Planctomycetaceae bacterium]|nr:threonine--tRNA ligase [Planctomycetaceae bacterium]